MHFPARSRHVFQSWIRAGGELSRCGAVRFRSNIIVDSSMKTQSWMLAAALALVLGSAAAQEKKASAASAQPSVAQRAEALTEDQINQSHDITALTKLAQLYGSQNDDKRLAWVLRRVSELTPNSGDLKMQLALVYAKMGDKRNAYDTLMRMQSQGFGYDISKDSRFDPIHGTRVWDYIVANLQVNAKPFGEGTVAFDLPKTDNLMTAFAWDAKRKSLLVGSQREGSIQLVDEKGKVTGLIKPSAENSLWGVDALGVDAVHGKLYVATSASPRFDGFKADNANKSAVLEFDLASGKFAHKYTLPNDGIGHSFNSMAVSKTGQVYVADSAHREILKVEGNALKPIVQNPKLTNIAAITVTDDGRALYLADYSDGIFGFDLSKGTPFELKYGQGQLVLGGVVGMHWYDGTLVIIEDGMVPKRVMRLKLSADGQSVANAMPLDVSSAAFSALGDGAVAGDNLYFVANRQDDLYDAHGVLTDASQAQPLKVYKSNMRFAWGQVGAMKSAAPIEPGKPGTYDKKPGKLPSGDDKH
jgi:hypothetical protein